MLFYGDDWRAVAPEDMIRSVERALEAAGSADGPRRRDRLTEALILSGELAQGVADAELAARGFDDVTAAQDAAMGLAVAVARLMLRTGEAGAVTSALAALRASAPRSPVRCKTPEGYAFYAVDPRRYADVAATHAWEGPPLVIGLRSIGTSLAAAVAARVGGEALTLRPLGHPFRRELRPARSLRRRLAEHDGPFAVVDEGPGLSGSSFGAAADLLEDLGVASERIVFLPSHGGDLGPRAAASHRVRWATATRLAADFAISAEEVGGWFSDLIGPVERVEDLSGGAWRDDVPEDERPPAAPAMERRKYRLTGPEGRYLARFAGLGTTGARKLEVARRLHAAGFTPEPLVVRRGFLLERWVEGERLAADEGRRADILSWIGRYLGRRARVLPAPERHGASLAELGEMAAHNAAELGGADLRRRVEARLAGLERLTGLAPTRIDGRTHPWEWIRPSGGGLCKTDPLDHAEGHDLVGPQDVAWDVAGAAVEFDLSERAAEGLRAAVGAEAGRAVDPEAVSAFRLCYAAFQAGAWSLAGEAAPTERARCEAQRDRYAAVLRRAVGLAGSPKKGRG